MTKEKEHLKTLTLAVSGFLKIFDTTMLEKEGLERGRKLAKLANLLDLHNDTAMKYGLGYSLKKIAKIKAEPHV